MQIQINKDKGSKSYFWNQPRFRAITVQSLFLAALILLFFYFYINTAENLKRINVTFGYDFLNQPAGFDIIQTPIAYTSSSSFARAIMVGVYNTIIVSAIAIVTSTFIGLIIALMRLSRNWLVSKVAGVYIDVFRNIPLLLQVIICYMLIITLLPAVRQAFNIGHFYLSQRGIVMPVPIFGDNAYWAVIGLIIGVVLAYVVKNWAKRRQEATGQPFPVVSFGLGVIVLGPIMGLLLAGWPLTWNIPKLGGFNFAGGTTVIPEFLALLVALTIYTSTFVAEIIRSGIQAVSRGQTEAARALGLNSGQINRLVILPQALRIIIPPMSSQYMGLTKNSTLGVAVAYPDLVAVGGIALNQKGRAIEVVLIWMVFYLGLSLLISAFMNWFNKRVKLVER